MNRAQDVYNIADNHARTVQVCIDHLHELGANEQLNRLTGRLQQLVVRSTPGDDDKTLMPLGANKDGLKGTTEQRLLTHLARSQ